MRRTIPLLAVVCLFAVAATPSAQAQAAANDEICAADDASAFSPEQRIAACTALIEAAKDAPAALAAALVNRGAASWYAHKTQAAFADFNRAIALDPTNARAFRERSNAFRNVGQLDRALADANEAVRLNPKDAKMFDNRGNVFNNNRQFDRAIADYDEALRLDPSFSLAFMDRGVAHYFKEEYQAAIQDYDESIKLDPKRSRAFTNRGAAYKKLGRNERALADESEAIKLDPLYPEYYDNRGLTYAENDDYDRAIADFNEAIRLAPQANFLTNRGDSYNRKGELDRAIADYDRALKLNPGFVLAYHNRGVAFRRKGDLERAISDFEQALRINPRMDSAAELLAAVRQERDRRDQISEHLLPTFDCATARRSVEKAICSDPDLSRLDRQIDDAFKAALAKLDRKGVARLRAEQREFNVKRDKTFGRPDYQLKRELEKRLTALRAMTARN
ncbi:MAG TPA: tetratricopeptide repeat protein [Pseudolabrys sp.]|jgi:tetratricopeptide (TPR) repeat protein